MTTLPTSEGTPKSQRVQFARIMILSALLLLPFCFLGYGSDNDTFGVVQFGYSTWHLHVLRSSRNPGYWTFEAIIHVLSVLGGYLASNLATLAVGVACIWRFLVIGSRLQVRFPGLLAACLVATPVFAIACTSTDDYVWSLLGIVLCSELLIADRLALAILPAAFAFAVRGANGMVIAGVILGAIVSEWLRHRRLTPRLLQILGVGVAAAALGSPPYILSYHLAGNSMHFADGMIGSATMWTLKMRVGRFIYKGLYLFGPLALLLLAAAGIVHRKPSLPPAGAVQDYRARAVPIFAGAVLSNLVLFFRFPIEISYLIPAGFFLLLLLGTMLLAKSRPLTVAFLLGILSANFVTIQFAQPNIPGKSTAANLHVALIPGQMVEDMHERIPLRRCQDSPGIYDCYLHTRVGFDPPAGK